MGQQQSNTLTENTSAHAQDAARAKVTRVSATDSESGHSRSAEIKSLFEHQRFADQGAFDEANGQEPVEQALSLFDQLSSQLTTSYRSLEQKVSQLKSDLSEEEIQRQEELREKEELASRLSTLLDVLPAGVVVLDGKGRVTQCNPAAIDLLGEPLLNALWLDIIKRSFSPKHDDGHEVSLRDGRRVRIETRSLKSAPGQLVLLSDLTETRLLQEKVSRTERLSSLGKMVASLAHQIRTPLSTAMLYAGHLCQPVISDSMRVDCAEKLLARLTHLEHQIRDMLIFAKGETRLAEQLTVKEFFDALRSAAEPVLAKAGVQCAWRNASGDRVIMCNREALLGACLNLINNSIEAAEPGKMQGRELKLNISASIRGDKSVCLLVRDNGPGIPESHQNRVFEPFYTTKPQGTGLGLAVVQAVVKAHHGVFKVDSSDQGVTTAMILPAYELKSSNQTPVRKSAPEKQHSSSQ